MKNIIRYTRNDEIEDRLWLMDMMNRFRRDMWVSQEELAEYVGISQPELSRIETGRGNPSYLLLMRVARTANKRIDFV